MRVFCLYPGLLLAATLFVLPVPAHAGEDDLRALPTDNRFGCANCHVGSGVTASFVPEATALTLNQFGLDWLEFGSAWSPEFAKANSDGDGCSNGFELGDPGGTWQPNDARLTIPTADQRNPGDASDCALPISEGSWGTLKSLFGS